MTPRPSEVPKHIRKQIGEAIWLLLGLLRGTPPDWSGETAAWVRQAAPVADSEFAENPVHFVQRLTSTIQ